MKKEWTYGRNYAEFVAYDQELDVCSDPKGAFVPGKRTIFSTFAAIDGRKTITFLKIDEKAIIAAKKSSIKKLKELESLNSVTPNPPLQSLTVNPQMNKEPLPNVQKPYDFKRPKVRVTMEELENAGADEDDTYETNAAIPGTSQRLQLKRNCKNNQNLISHQIDECEDDLNESDESLEKFIDNAVESALETLEPHEYLPGCSYRKDGFPEAKDVSPTDSKQIFCCEICSTKFKDESSLNDHVSNSTYCYNYYMQDYGY